MVWQHIIALTLAAIGGVGFCLMIAAAVMIALQGGWKQSIQEPIAEGRWPLSRRVLLVGAFLGAAFGVGIVVLSLIPAASPFRN